MTEIDIDRLIKEIRDLKIRVARLESEQPGVHLSPNNNKTRLQVGDRVKIHNKIRKPKNWPTERDWTEPLERLAIITRITSDRIYITTDNGTLTWRQPGNLSKIHQ
jgi:hypothetical protein